MGEGSAIAWTNHTFNPWWGCDKVSPACKHCYADNWARTRGFTGKPRTSVNGPPKPVLPLLWGPDSERRFFGETHWAEPRKWNRQALEAGRPALVFCASMADVGEDRPELVPVRRRLGVLIEQTPWLIWQLLTKRAERLAETRAELWPEAPGGWWPHNVWLGVTAEDQEYADLRVPLLLASGCKTLFVSCEPALEVVQWRPQWLGLGRGAVAGVCVDINGESWHPAGTVCADCGVGMPRLSWIIVGGESGRAPRPFNLDCVRNTQHATRGTDVAVFTKQLGARPFERLYQETPTQEHPLGGDYYDEFIKVTDNHGANRDEWPHDVDVRQFPAALEHYTSALRAVTKLAAAGRVGPA